MSYYDEFVISSNPINSNFILANGPAVSPSPRSSASSISSNSLNIPTNSNLTSFKNIATAAAANNGPAILITRDSSNTRINKTQSINHSDLHLSHLSSVGSQNDEEDASNMLNNEIIMNKIDLEDDLDEEEDDDDDESPSKNEEVNSVLNSNIEDDLDEDAVSRILKSILYCIYLRKINKKFIYAENIIDFTFNVSIMKKSSAINCLLIY